MRAGRLRHRLMIQQGTESRTATGDVSVAWSTYLTVWGSLTPLRGHERTEAQQMSAKIEYRATIRYPAGYTVTPKMRLKLGDRYFLIEAVLDVCEMHRELHLYCSEWVD